ncbi:MAG: hypothetical protein L6R38_009055 [Xanthoria sp. 2 TBL-2021]|nr:MAG: hypothetical protein L6R38_009055 [Xanthoria sp. 2 TBL-2021]
MKVLLLGATGNLGSRLIPALLAHNHSVVIFVRSESKLKSLVDSAALSKCTIVNGDATNTRAIEEAILNNQCNALINSAGRAAIFPWEASKMQGIIQAVATAVVEASKKLGYPIRCWFLGGLTVLDFPGKKGTKMSYYFPLFQEHGHTLDCISRKPKEYLQWSLLAPSAMTPANKEITVLQAPRGNPLAAKNDMPANWSPTFLSGVPYLGIYADIAMNMMRYNTTLEDCADFMAADLTKGESEHVGHKVGIIVSNEKKGQ